MSGLITGLNGHSKARTLVDSTGAEYSVGDLDDTEVLTVSGSSIVSGAGSSSGGAWYSTRPTYMGSASAYDDEFTADTSANYTISPALSGTAIDSYVTITTNPRINWAVRSSHMTVQVADNAGCSFAKAITLDTNCWFWARVSVPSNSARAAGSTSDRTEARLVLCENATLTGHYVWVSLGQGHDGTNQYQARAWKNDSGGSAGVGTILAGDPGEPFTQIFIQKVSSVYYFYAGTDDGYWCYLGTHTYSGNTLDNMILWMFDDGSVPGSAVVHWDFIRYGAAKVILP